MKINNTMITGPRAAMQNNTHFGRTSLNFDADFDRYYDFDSNTDTLSWRQPATRSAVATQQLSPLSSAQSAINALVYASMAAGLMMIGLVKYLK